MSHLIIMNHSVSLFRRLFRYKVCSLYNIISHCYAVIAYLLDQSRLIADLSSIAIKCYLVALIIFCDFNICMIP